MTTTLSTLHSTEAQAERIGKQEAAKLTARGYAHKFIKAVKVTKTLLKRSYNDPNASKIDDTLAAVTSEEYQAIIQEI